MTEYKICSKCNQAKEEESFYLCSGKLRSECRKCTIKANVRYQRIVQSWRYAHGDKEGRNRYMREYYAKNKDKFIKYRENFSRKSPDYYKDYFKKKKNGQ